jgi:hypothetical protein
MFLWTNDSLIKGLTDRLSGGSLDAGLAHALKDEQATVLR